MIWQYFICQVKLAFKLNLSTNRLNRISSQVASSALQTKRAVSRVAASPRRVLSLPHALFAAHSRCRMLLLSRALSAARSRCPALSVSRSFGVALSRSRAFSVPRFLSAAPFRGSPVSVQRLLGAAHSGCPCSGHKQRQKCDCTHRGSTYRSFF